MALLGSLRSLSSSSRLQIASPWQPQPSHLESWVWADLFGADAPLPLTRSEAMSVAPLARARHLICGTIAAFSIRDYRGDDLTDPQPAWIDRTDTPTSPYHRLLWTVDDLLFYGWSLWSVSRGDAGVVLTAQRIPYDRWSFDENGLILLDNDYPTHPELLVLIPGSHEGLLTFAKRTIRHASNLVVGADRAAETPTPNLELHQTNDARMTETDIEKLVQRWAAARRGKNGGVAYTNSAIEVKEHGQAAENLLISGRNAAAVDIARAVGIPASMIDADAGSSLTYQTVEGRNREFVDYGLSLYMSPISARLGMDDVTPRGRRIAFDLEEYLGGLPAVFGPQDDNAADTHSTPPGATAAPPVASGGSQ